MKKLLLIPVALIASTALAAPKISAQSIIVNPTQPDLGVSVRIDRDPSGRALPNYRVGEPIVISTTVNRDAYVYLFNVDSTGEVTQILPNRLQGGGNFVKANTTAYFPSTGSNFTFNVDGQAGINKVLALASSTELNLSQLSSFKSSQDTFATTTARGQDQLAQALSIIVNPLQQNTWVSDTVMFNVLGAVNVSTGSLFVGTNVSGSTIYLDGRPLGPANTTYNRLNPGMYPVIVRAPGYEDYSTTLRIGANLTANLSVELVLRTGGSGTMPAPVRPAPMPPMAAPAPAPVINQFTLTINSQVNGARIFVDGTEVGSIQNGGIDARVSRGSHEVVMIAPGYRSFINLYTILRDSSITINPSR